MSLIHTPDTIDDAPVDSRPTLEAIHKQMGRVPNIFRLISNSPAALIGLTSLQGALAKGKLTPATRERLALAMAVASGCDNCLSAHTYTATRFAKLDENEIISNRNGTSNDPKAAAAVQFARGLLAARGAVAPTDVEMVRAASYSDAEILEVVAHVALNTFTNYVNEALSTEIDFPSIERLSA